MPDSVTADVIPCRSVTAEEVAHYNKFGWVKLKRFLDPEVLTVLLKVAKGRMGDDGDSNQAYGIDQPYFNAEYAGGLTHPPIRALIDGLGRASKAFVGREVEARYFQDFFAPKLPAAKKTKNAGNGPTAFHQDFITFAVDRTGGMTFWIPLEAYGPEYGTMSFINGSHNTGVLGSYHTYGDRDLRDIFPVLRELDESDQMAYELGDITVHSHLTVHGASSNMTDMPRWTYIVLTQPADAVWNGAPPEAFDTTGMTPNQPFDDEKFPIIS
ncbi:MAG: phytanoyl-CoA dioxygenase [Sphingomonadales bacterium]|nr:MAG: phytanoyl-CoA dioxygenase [Sphingomonadales bacterium]